MHRLQLTNPITLCLFCLLMAQDVSHANELEPVLIGLEAELDACPSLAEITTKKPVALFAKPAVGAKTITLLKPKQAVYLCDGSKTAPWVGVVVPDNDKTDCGVSSNIVKPKPYQGPCKSGWIKQSEFEVTAG